VNFFARSSSRLWWRRSFSPWLDVTPRFSDLALPNWVQERAAKRISSELSELPYLDAGETAAIALALEIHADAILIDDRQGHAAAARVGLVVIGLLGVLLQARTVGLIPAIGPALKALREDAGFWISDSLHREILRLAGEKS
jgi:predicted nucleic acid-binding protein